MKGGVQGKNRTPEARQQQLFRAGWVVDGCGGPVAKDQVVRIDGGRIASVEPYRPSSMRNCEVIDLSDATLLPALMDAHVHLALSGSLNPDLRKAQLEQTPRQAGDAILNHLRAHLDNGIVAVRDAGDNLGQAPKVKAGQSTGVHMAATCWAWHAPGRYGKMIGRSPGPGESLAAAVAHFCQGMDHIKLIQSGVNSLDRFGHETPPQFSNAELSALHRFASAQAMPIMVHANGNSAVRSAIDAGCDSIEHGYFMGRDNLHRMTDRQVFWVPTLIPMAAMTREGAVSPSQADVARRTLEHQMQQIVTAHKVGVRIALGTDAGSMGVDHGAAVHGELALLMSAGLSLPEAVRCATLHVAQLMRLKHRGALRTGWRADFIAVHGSPEFLPESLANIAGVCLEGQWRKKSR